MFEVEEVTHLLGEIAVLTGLEREAARVDLIAAYERVVRAAQAGQYEQIRALYEDHPAGGQDLQVIGEVSLARNVSPGAAGTQFGHALALGTLPSVETALAEGRISDPTARAICTAAAPLHVDDRVLFDHEISTKLDGLTPGRARRLAERIALSLDDEAATERAERSRADQRVTLCPEADGVAVLMVRGPAEQMVAAHQVLETWALGLRSGGDERTVGQIMCATLVERVTGLTHAPQADVEIGILIDADTLAGAAANPAEVTGYGPIAPGIADAIISRSHRAFYRRLITDPIDRTLIARDPRRRRFDGPLAGFIRARDHHRCRQPGCDCRIRDLDHIHDYADGGPTTATNGQGLCRRSHTLKHLPDWTVTTAADGTTTWHTRTGHTYTSPVPTYG